MSERSFHVEVDCAPPGHAPHTHVLEVASTGYVPGAIDLREVSLRYTCPVAGEPYKAIFTPLKGHKRPFRLVSLT